MTHRPPFSSLAALAALAWILSPQTAAAASDAKRCYDASATHLTEEGVLLTDETHDAAMVEACRAANQNPNEAWPALREHFAGELMSVRSCHHDVVKTMKRQGRTFMKGAAPRMLILQACSRGAYEPSIAMLLLNAYMQR